MSYSDDDTFMSTPMSEKEGEVTAKGLFVSDVDSLRELSRAFAWGGEGCYR